MTAPHDDFGNYLSSVAERDIDLLLMEEFHVSDAFVKWFAARVGESETVPDGAWHSVSDTDGETDLLLRVRKSDVRIGILIENKIAAPEQDQQAERYHLRGIRSREEGRFDRYVTVMCAPELYLSSLAHDSPYQFRVSYEEIADWFALEPDKRSQWRKAIIEEAIAHGRRGYTMAVNEVTTRFHRQYWEYLGRSFPSLIMAEPGNKGPKSQWIILKMAHFPKGVQLHHKVDRCLVELGFDGFTISDILGVQAVWPENISVVQRGKTASLSIHVPIIEMAAPLDEQKNYLNICLKAAIRLGGFARLFVP